MSGGAYSLANIRAGLKSFALGKVVTAPMSFVVVLLLAAHMVKAEYASYVSAMRQVSIVIGAIGGALLFREPAPVLRIAAALVILSGVACIAAT